MNERNPGLLLLVAAGLVAGGPAWAQPAAGNDSILGVWRNPAGTVGVRTEYCGSNLCGVIVRAAPAAVADAQKAGVSPLVGVHLLQSFVKVDTGAWSGTAFVPDMNIHVSAHVSLTDTNRMKISGCEFGGLVCKSQEWTRVASN